LTTGSDRKITYWEKFDGQVIRKIDGSEEGELNALAITHSGEHFVTGGEDTILRIWGYDDGQKYYEGCGHSGAITKIQISPDQKTIVSVGTEGAIFIWNTPIDVQHAKPESELPTITKEKPKEKNEKAPSQKGSVAASKKK